MDMKNNAAWYGEVSGERFDFDGTEDGFISSALKAGVKVGLTAYLMPGNLSIRIYRNEWLGKMGAACSVSLEPLRVVLERRRECMRCGSGGTASEIPIPSIPLKNAGPLSTPVGFVCLDCHTSKRHAS